MGVANSIYDRLGELQACCDTIRDACKCDECPLKDYCLEESTFERVATKVKVVSIDKMVAMADEITDAEYEAQKTEEQKRWEHEADEWLDRRHDPDDYE